MKETERIKRINADLNAHYTSNKDCWWVSNSGYSTEMIELHKGDINNRLKGVQIAKFIFSKEKSVNIIHYGGACMVYTRTSVKNYSPRRKK
jgi:hypothetical protein